MITSAARTRARRAAARPQAGGRRDMTDTRPHSLIGSFRARARGLQRLGRPGAGDPRGRPGGLPVHRPRRAEPPHEPAAGAALLATATWPRVLLAPDLLEQAGHRLSLLALRRPGPSCSGVWTPTCPSPSSRRATRRTRTGPGSWGRCPSCQRAPAHVAAGRRRTYSAASARAQADWGRRHGALLGSPSFWSPSNQLRAAMAEVRGEKPLTPCPCSRPWRRCTGGRWRLAARVPPIPRRARRRRARPARSCCPPRAWPGDGWRRGRPRRR